MLKLPDVTLVAIETREYELMRLAISDCIAACEFGDIVIATDKPLEFWMTQFNQPKPRLVKVPDWDSKLGWCRYVWFGLPQYIRTSHMLLCQWDAGVWDTSMWRDEFMAYDYVGAVWGWHQTKKVGNSGFALKSTRLARYIHARAWDFPCDTPLEDDLLCRKYRPVLEERGFRWAPEGLAHDFAFECSRPSPTSRHFGYHAMFNWPFVLPHDRVLERVRLATGSPYLRESYMMKSFCEKHPQIIMELLGKTSDQEDGNASNLGLPRETTA
jgi:hypothetical protein